MKAVRIHKAGGPEVLHYETVPDPLPAAGQVVIRVEAAGVNFIDVYQRNGLYQIPLPATLGQEAGGTVEAVAPDVASFRAGDRVAYFGPLGAYAELVAVAAERIVRLPEGMTAKQGAAAMLQGMTAHYLACSTRPLDAGDTCLIHAAAGGVGLLLCQIARRRGASVIGTVSTPEKATLAREAGADQVILYAEQDFETEVHRLTGGAGVQVVYDSVGRTTFEKSLRCLARRGMLVLFGQSSGPVGPFDPQVLNQRGSVYLTRPSLGHYTATREELLQRAGEVLGWVRDGTLVLRVGGEFPLSQAAVAHRELEARATAGKLLLIPGA